MLVRTQTQNNGFRVINDCMQSRPLDSNEPPLSRQSFFTVGATYTHDPLPIDESYIELAVAVFQAQSLSSLQFLKDFLTVLANPVSIEKVLLHGIYRLAETHPRACRWLLSEPSYLMPELDFVNFTQQFVIATLHEKDFDREQIALLENSQPATDVVSLQQQNDLWQNTLTWILKQPLCPGDRFLIEATLKFIQKSANS